MITLPVALSILRQLLPQLQRRYPIAGLGIFGSVARGDQNESSDLDVLVELNGEIGWEFVDLADEIEQAAGVKVDLVSDRGIKECYRPFVMKDLIRV